MRIALTTCEQYPELSASDALLAADLADRGHEVHAAPWNGPDHELWTSWDMVVLRSNWDFHEDIDRFDTWLWTMEASQTELVNPAPLVRWNTRKSYLLELAEQGVLIPRTWIAHAGAQESKPAWIKGSERLIIKPMIGASGKGVALVKPVDVDQVIADSDRKDALVLQEFVTDVGGGEWALVFFAGDFSHAFQRVPVAGEYRVNSGFGGTVRAGHPDRGLVTLANEVLGLLQTRPVYARVDLVVSDDGPVVMEVEVNEPSLCLDLHPDAPRRFADALLTGR